MWAMQIILAGSQGPHRQRVAFGRVVTPFASEPMRLDATRCDSTWNPMRRNPGHKTRSTRRLRAQDPKTTPTKLVAVEGLEPPTRGL